MGILEKIKDIEFEVRGGHKAGRQGGSLHRALGCHRSAATTVYLSYSLPAGRAATHSLCPAHCLCCLLQMGRTQKNKATEYHLGGLGACYWLAAQELATWASNLSLLWARGLSCRAHMHRNPSRPGTHTSATSKVVGWR